MSETKLSQPTTDLLRRLTQEHPDLSPEALWQRYRSAMTPAQVDAMLRRAFDQELGSIRRTASELVAGDTPAEHRRRLALRDPATPRTVSIQVWPVEQKSRTLSLQVYPVEQKSRTIWLQDLTEEQEPQSVAQKERER